MADDWKFFVIDITYLIPANQMGNITPQHRAFLKSGYEQGWLLISGPQVPPTGGMIVAKAPSREALEAYFSHDPYQVNKVAEYRYIEFNPVFRSTLLEDWVTK